MRPIRRRHGARAGFVVALCLAAGGAGAQSDDELEDILGGFEDEAPVFEIERSDEESTGADERFWDLSGSVEISGSVNYLDHRSDTGTDYGGLQRLRNQLNLELDLDGPADWKARVDGWGFYDAAYAIQGRGDYTSDVRRDYELDAELGEAWIAGRLASGLDLKLGRQVVIWGRSETLRVLDIINPLDNREPARVDIENLYRPLGMLRLDGYAGDWSATALVIPEIRFDRLPVVGSDFFPGAFEPSEKQPRDFEDLELAGALTATKSGWDLSFHGAWFWDDRPRLSRSAFPLRLVHDRLWLVGAGGNYTLGSWLLKAELAFRDGLGFAASREEKSRLDGLIGVEYYGFVDTTLVLEVAERHLFDHERGLKRAPDATREDTVEIAARVSRNFWNDTLHLTAVGVVLGLDARDGAILRVDLDYDVLDALVVGVGVVLYQQGDLSPLDTWGDNDRLIFKLKWSF